MVKIKLISFLPGIGFWTQYINYIVTGKFEVVIKYQFHIEIFIYI